jgi:hypothetical protein
MKQGSTLSREGGSLYRLLPPAYLLLLAVYPVLALAAANPHQGIRLADLIFPSLAAIWFALVSWAASALFTSELYKRSIIAILWIVWFAGYGYVTPALTSVARVLHVDPDSVGIPVTFAASVGFSIWIARTRRTFRQTSRAARAASCILMVFPVTTYLADRPRTDSAAAWNPGPVPVFSSDLTRRPDIYFIVLDQYTGSQSLKRNFGFDNSRFEADLEARGFSVPRNARSNYLSTFLALASMLNWTYLDELPVELDKRSMDRSYPAAMIEDNRALRFLKAAGYEFVFMPASYPQTAANRHADRVLGPRGEGPAAFPEFLVAWLETTPARPLVRVVCWITHCQMNELPFQAESAERIRWKFSLLGELAGQQGPKFVFAHLLVPHPPYVFERDCSPRPPGPFVAVDSVTDRQIREAYVGQVQCVNRLVLDLVDRLKAGASEPPVIILQADHGYRGWWARNPPASTEPHPDDVRERADIFAAYHMPRASRELYDSITLVNVLPLMLRHYFGAEIPPVEDRTYYSTQHEPYRFIRLH